MKKLAILIAAIALVAFSVPAMAVDWNFYGNARMAIFWTSDNNSQSGTTKGNTNVDGLQWDFQGNSRIGAKVKADKIKAQFEFGVSESNVTSRRLYGVWNFGPGKLKVGKDYTPISQFISGQVGIVDDGMLGLGLLYGYRAGQVALSLGRFNLALVTPNNGRFANGRINGMSTGNPKTLMPKLEASWGMAFDTWNFALQGGFNYYSIKGATRTAGSKIGKKQDVSVTSYLLGATTGFNFGPAYVKGAVSWGVNSQNGGWLTQLTPYFGGTTGAVWDGKSSSADDNEYWGVCLVSGFAVSDMLRFEAGGGFSHQSPDGGKTSDVLAAYLQSVITLAPGVFLVPEVGYWDTGTALNGTKLGNNFYAGGKWQINF